MPANAALYAYVPPGKNNNASALVNLARNLGGSVFISLITMFPEHRQQFHQSRLVEKPTPLNHHFQSALSSYSRYFSSHTHGSAVHEAYRQIYRLVQQQAGMLAYTTTITCWRLPSRF